MEGLFEKILAKAADSPMMMVIIAGVGGVLAFPKIKNMFVIEGAAEKLRREMTDLLHKERARTESLMKELDKSRDEEAKLSTLTAGQAGEITNLKSRLEYQANLYAIMMVHVRRSVATNDPSSMRFFIETLAPPNADLPPTPL